MNELMKKLQIKETYRGQIVNPPNDMEGELAAWPSSYFTKDLNASRKSGGLFLCM